jgi:hypothetical protein
MNDSKTLNAGRRIAKNRKRVCEHCHASLLSSRADAEFCSNRCRQAAHRKRDARAKAESLFKTRQQSKPNAFDQFWHSLESYQDWATLSNAETERRGVKHVRFMGTNKGLLAVEGLIDDAHVDDPPWLGVRTQMSRVTEHDPANPEAGDPEVVEAVVEALKLEPLAGSFIRQEYEKECRALLRGPVRRIALFTHDPDWRDKRPPGGWPALLTWADDWDVEDNVQDDPDRGSFNGDDLLAGGGYSTFKA